MASHRALAALAVALALSGCRVVRTHECRTDGDCAGAGASVRCETIGFCSVAEASCASGWRYDTYAGNGLAGECVADVGADDAGLPDAPVVDAAPDARVCPAGYVVVGALPNSYRLSTTDAMWLAAEADCEDDGTGTHLAVIDTAAENTALQTLIGTPNTWFGLTDRKTEGTYRTVTNVVQTYLPWGTSPTEPDGTDDCVGVDEAAFRDENCTDVQPFVCECDGIAAVPSSYTP